MEQIPPTEITNVEPFPLHLTLFPFGIWEVYCATWNDGSLVVADVVLQWRFDPFEEWIDITRNKWKDGMIARTSFVGTGQIRFGLDEVVGDAAAMVVEFAQKAGGVQLIGIGGSLGGVAGASVIGGGGGTTNIGQ